MLLGHLDTVIPHDQHRPLTEHGDRLGGSGTIDMKGGDAIALALLAEVSQHPDWCGRFAQLDLLLVCDEEWRHGAMHHAARFAGYDACLCFEAGERDGRGDEAVVVRRKAAGTVEVRATGRAAHAGAAPDEGRNALLALATVALTLASLHDPHGDQQRSVVPSLLSAGEGVNIVPGGGELIVDIRARDESAFAEVLAAVPHDVGEVRLDAQLGRSWPGMDAAAAAAPILDAAALHLGRPIVPAARGGASDASHIATVVPLTIDGLGPLGAGSHAAHEHALASSFLPRSEVALALLAAILERTNR